MGQGLTPNEIGPAKPEKRSRPSPPEVIAGTLVGLIIAGVCGALVILFFVVDSPHANPEPAPGQLAVILLAMVAGGGALAAIGGAFRGAGGCIFLPLTLLLSSIIVGWRTGQSIGLGWFWWWPCAIVLLIPVGALIGLSAEIGTRLLRRARSPLRCFALLGALLCLVYGLGWFSLYAAQRARDRILTDPANKHPVPAPAEPAPFPNQMAPSAITPTDQIEKPHAE
jgi:hypothetical protein